ncbi:DUF3135 domain-containing protein [Photobacterium kagoshimensis]|uniref:DUF3135 domain-containing protein n=1 Tax=Photobacterium kagoshimensis TaxID=2910242 RepID=UPI003D139175
MPVHTPNYSTCSTNTSQSLPSFDELKAMAEQDPEALEALRITMSQHIIDNASSAMQPRLQAQLSHINQVIASGKNPNHVNVLLRKELHKQFIRFSQALTAPETITCQQADIKPFCRPSSSS